MGKLSTSDVSVTGGTIRKELEPGNKVLKINSITLDKVPWGADEWYLNINTESEPLGEEFEGFFIDNNDHSKGQYLGQTGRIRASGFTFGDKTVNGREFKRDDGILKCLKNLFSAMGEQAYIDSIEKETVEQIIDQLNKDQVWKDKWYNVCIGGKMYMKDGFVKYDLNLPQFSKKVPVELVNTVPSRLITFNKEMHIYVSKSAKEEAPVKKSGKSDFDVE